MKKFMAILLTVAMIFTVAAISASAADTDVAAIGSITFETLQDAIDVCGVGTNTITLLADCDETVTIKQEENRDIIIDGNGKNYSGTITVNGAGRTTGTETVTIKNVNFAENATGYETFIDLSVGNAHNIEIDSCTFKSNNWHYAIKAKHNFGEIAVKNCTADTVYYFLYNSQGGEKITVENCTVTSATYGIGSQKCIETYVKNYTYTGKAAGIYGRSSANESVLTMENVDITTTLNNQAALALWKNDDKTTSKTFKFVLFGDNNKFTTVEGTPWFKPQSTTNSPYEIVELDLVAAIGDKEYTSIKEAVAAANDGDVITVIKDHAIADSEAYFGTAYPSYYVFLEVSGKKVTIDLNGKVVTLNPDLDKMLLAIFLADANGEITLKDSSEAKTGAINVTASDAASVYSMFMADNGGKFNIESGNYYLNKVDISDKAPRAMLYAGSDKLFTVNGGNFVLANAHTETTVFGKGEEAYDVAHPWIANVHGDGKGTIAINAGSFNVDPSHHHGEASYPVCYAPVETDGKWVITLGHTPGAESTCMTAQTCTVCGEELAPTTDHVLGDYVSDDNATCTADGTKTAECIYGCGEKDTVADEGSMKKHTPGAAATCQAAQTCTVCGTELDAIKEHELGEYVSDGNATCKEDGTKTAECIYGCGLKDTVADKGSATGHNDADGNGRCDGCDAKFCDTCGKVHDNWMSLLFCLIVDFVNLVISFFSSVK